MWNKCLKIPCGNQNKHLKETSRNNEKNSVTVLRFSFVWEETNFENIFFCYFTQRAWYGREHLSEVREWTGHIWVESTIQDEQVQVSFQDYVVFTNQAEKYLPVIEFYFQNSHTMFHLFFDLSDNVSGIFFTGISCI